MVKFVLDCLFLVLFKLVFILRLFWDLVFLMVICVCCRVISVCCKLGLWFSVLLMKLDRCFMLDILMRLVSLFVVIVVVGVLLLWVRGC